MVPATKGLSFTSIFSPVGRIPENTSLASFIILVESRSNTGFACSINPGQSPVVKRTPSKLNSTAVLSSEVIAKAFLSFPVTWGITSNPLDFNQVAKATDDTCG
ncbi:103aa long hypothetical protein [Pyrococcus horikoshii OT3]|uniref:Uncharacterized protein n=1 Tax=Pyrococcus horikoshii (strain ATCC 700860 / DSM 12428 / JCM 9974 / NBRC 100139 / OT-3) TaxID=70601 RepID=O58819_PYRHO|nr:103aa long hypothetical protein [Pyrococcus horikoshii OT3]